MTIKTLGQRRAKKLGEIQGIVKALALFSDSVTMDQFIEHITKCNALFDEYDAISEQILERLKGGEQE